MISRSQESPESKAVSGKCATSKWRIRRSFLLTVILAYNIRVRVREAFPMPDGLQDLLSRRAEIVQPFARLGDLRSGSVSNTSGRCGKPDGWDAGVGGEVRDRRSRG